MIINTNIDKHYFLYAKGWYKRSGTDLKHLLKDLTKIHAVSYIVPDDCVEIGSILNKLTNIASRIILQSPKGSIEAMQDFIFAIAPDAYWKVSPGKYTYEESVLRNCLSLMMFADVDGLVPKDDLDFTILPRKEKYYTKDIK